MDFYANVKKLEDKMSETLADHNLLFNFSTKHYPAVLTVSQNQDTDAQMEIYSTAVGSVSSKDAALRLIFKLTGIEIQTDNRLVISEDLMNKIKSTAKNMYAAYCSAFFAEHRSAEGQEPVTENAGSGLFDGFYNEDGQDEDPGNDED